MGGVYQFTDDAPVVVSGDGLKWLGYENVGANYEPGFYYGKDGETGVSDSGKLADYIGKGKIVLDIGCGLGGSAISFAKAGLCVIAADISQNMLEIAVKRAEKLNAPKENLIFVRMNGYKLELDDNSVDAVLAQDVLFQVDRPELMMAEILRVLKPGGYFLQYGNGKNLGFTPEQEAVNQLYNDAYKDISDYYNKAIGEGGYAEPAFKSWDKADECINKNFKQIKKIEGTGVYAADNLEWSLKIGLHKIKTRASGAKSVFIPDELHDGAWRKTDEYAQMKYGEDYEDIVRFYNHESVMIVYKRRQNLIKGIINKFK